MKIARGSEANSHVCQTFGIEFPLFLAGMGGVAGPALTAAVSEAGGAGTLGLYRCPPEYIPELLNQTQTLTSRPFGVNFVPEVTTETALLLQLKAVVHWLEQRQRTIPQTSHSSGQTSSPRVPPLFVSFYGIPPASAQQLLNSEGLSSLIQIGSKEEAEKALELQPTALIIQGIEAGGHLLGDAPIRNVLLGLMSQGIHEQCPLLAAGTIATADDLIALEPLGVSGAVCGTLFIGTWESDAHIDYKRKVLKSYSKDTVITQLFESGWPGRKHRVLHTELLDKPAPLPARFIATSHVYGAQHVIPRYAAAVPLRETRGRVEEMALYCGMSCERLPLRSEELPAAGEIVRQFRTRYQWLKRGISEERILASLSE